MTRAVTFDAAGTLFAPREPVGVTYARVAREHGIATDPAAVEQAFRHALRTAPPLAFPGATGGTRARLERAWWRDVVRRALGRAAAEHPRFDACFDTLFVHYAGATAWTVFADVLPALRDARARGLGTGVVSNFDGRLPGLLDELGLATSFDAIVWSSAVGAAKPAPAIFAAAARRMGLEVADVCHVGDDPDADVAGATAAGLTALRLDRTGADTAAIGSLAALARRLDDLTRGGR